MFVKTIKIKKKKKKPLHTNFVLPEQGLALCYTCPVYFGNADSKQTVLKTICNSIHPKIHQEWGTFACQCGLVPRLKLSQTPRNPNKVFLCCPKEREARCNYFQWIHRAPKPVKVPKASTPSALKKRMHEMVRERLQKRPKVEAGGFKSNSMQISTKVWQGSKNKNRSSFAY